MKKKKELSKKLHSRLYNQEAFRPILLLSLSVVKRIFLHVLNYAMCDVLREQKQGNDSTIWTQSFADGQ